jgi:hypothetical protein
MSVCGGVAGLGYGFLMDMAGYPMLSVISGVATLLLFYGVRSAARRGASGAPGLLLVPGGSGAVMR